MADELSVLDVILRVLLALGPAAVIGGERELALQPAGLRTHLLLGLGAVLFTLAGIAIMDASPARVAAQVASGVGFLGAGAILRERLRVRGLTTAASLWVTAALGVAAGAGAYSAVATVTVVALAVLVALKWVERQFLPRQRDHELSVSFAAGVNLGQAFEDVRGIVGPLDLRQVEPLPDGGQRLVGGVALTRSQDLLATTAELRALPGVTGVNLAR